ncbi:MAG: serine/threonine-protein kinase [Nannocystales bacterium]
MEDGGSDAGVLLGPPPPPNALREELALATVQRRLFDSHVPAPVLRRYVLLEAIGSGGFGVVLRAYDPELEREVAVKLLRIHVASTPTGLEALLREARIMAQLSHPNTVTVHDVGRYESRDLGSVGSQVEDLGIPVPGVFLVMELVERGTLQQQLDAGLSPEAALPMLLDAGRGLAAAHALRIVHRDVKPGNVLVDGEGRVRVADFGLSQPVTSEVRDAAGTKPYMAPERLAGGAATPASDQYSFALMCAVALWRTSPARARTLLHGSARTPRGLKRRLRAVLARALSPAPEDRHASMDALVEAMTAASRPRRRRLLIGGALLGASAVVVPFVLTGEDPCARAGQGITGTWTPSARRGVEASLTRDGSSYAAESSVVVVRALDAYAERWAVAAGEACADTHVRRVQSEARLDVRIDCLERLRLEFAEAVDLLQEADASLLPRAVEVVHGLGWIAACDEPTGEPSRLPEDPDARSRHAERSRRLARAKLLELSGRYAEAMALADEVSSDHEAGEVQRAMARLRHGSAAAARGRYVVAKASLLESIQIAEAAHADAVVVDGWLRLLWVAGVELGETEGETWADFARAALDRLGDDARREAELAHGLGGLAYRAERYDEALTHYQRALRVQKTLLTPDDPTLARTLNHIANVLIMLADYDGAERHIEQSLAIRRGVLGEHHPLVAAALNNLVLVHLERGNLARARVTLAHAESITDGLDGPEASVVAELHKRLAKAEGKP